MDVRVDGGPQDGTILVTWIPSSTHGLAARQAPVTGYAVFADGKRVTDVDSPTSKNQTNFKIIVSYVEKNFLLIKVQFT